MENLKIIIEIDKEFSIGIIGFYNYSVVEFDDILKAEQESVDIIKNYNYLL